MGTTRERDEDQALRTVLAGCFAASFAGFVAMLLVGPARDQLLGGTCVAAFGGLLVILRLGWGRLAMLLTHSFMLIFGIVAVSTAGGTNDLLVVFFPVSVMLSRLLLAPFPARVFVFLAVVSPIVIALAEAEGWLVTGSVVDGYDNVFGVTVIMVATAIIAGALRRAIDNNIERVTRAEHTYRQMFNATTEAIFVCDVDDGRIIDANESAQRMFEVTRSELLRRCVDELKVEGGAAPEGRGPLGIARFEEWFVASKQGRQFWVEVSFKHAEIEESVRTLAVVRDVNEVRAVRERMVHAEKLEALGQLAGGIAHDFNNQLTAISMSAGLLAHRCTAPAEEGLIATIVTAAKRSQGLTEQLLTFARRGKRANVTFDVCVLLDEAAAVLGRSVDKRIVITVDHPDDPLVVNGDSHLLANALLNLGLNARDALPDGGHMRFSAVAESLSEGDAISQGLSPGDYIHIVVSDDGVGMNDKTCRQIFDPFFTTKVHGTGLGLAAVLGAVQMHAGAIQAHSRPGNGTTFDILLPACQSAVASAAEPALALPVVRSRTILLIDDESAVAAAIEAMLVEDGATVVVARDGESGLEAFRNDPGRFACAIVDIDLPKMRGPDVIAEMYKIRSEFPVLLVTGFGMSDLVLEGSESASVVLRKPFSPQQLRIALAEILTEASADSLAESTEPALDPAL